jgi:hypothetical protein
LLQTTPGVFFKLNGILAGLAVFLFLVLVQAARHFKVVKIF